jgi:PKD repeat protein
MSGFADGGQGGAAYNGGGSAPVYVNCVFRGNEARAALFSDGLGGALYTSGAAPHIVNCTFAHNRSYGSFFSSGAGGALYNQNASTRTLNSILWGNQPNQVANSGGAPTFAYCDVQGGVAGTGNISLDPRWTNATGGDFTLRDDSPCIDKGTPEGAPAVDIRGVLRPQGAGVDMGAYEWGEAPRAAFDANPVRGAAPLAVAFTDKSTPGTSPITAWEWRDGETVFSTGQDPAYTFTVPGAHAITLTVRSDAGEDTSLPIVIEVEAVLLLTDQPNDLDVYTGESAEFRVQVDGAKGPVTFQWWYDDGTGEPIPVDCDTPVLSINTASPDDAGSYWCVVSDGNTDLASETARMRVADPLAITVPLQDAAVPEGASHTFEITVEGGFTPLSCIWDRDGVSLDAAGPQLVLPGVGPQDEGAYRVTVSDLYTARQDTASLTVLTGVPAHTPAALALLAAVLAGLGALAAGGTRSGRAGR